MEDAGGGEEAVAEGYQSSPMESIEEDALLEVLARVTSKELLIVKAVCRRWYGLINDGRLQTIRRTLGREEEWLCIFDARTASPLQGHLFSSNPSGWREIRPLDDGIERVGFQVLGVGSHVWLLGGAVFAKAWTEVLLTNKVDVYDVIANSWALGPRLLTPRSYFACGLLDDGRMIIAGGDDGCKSAEILDPTKNEWRMLPDMPTVSSRCTGQVLGSRFYVVRLSDNRLPSTINAYDPSSNRWLVLDLPDWDFAGNPLLSVARWSDFGLGVAGPKHLAFVGGIAHLNHNSPFQVLDSVMTYDVEAQTVRKLCEMPADYNNSRSVRGGRKGCECVTTSGVLCVVGGSRRVGPVTWERTGSILLLDKVGWRRITQMLVAPKFPVCAVIKLP